MNKTVNIALNNGHLSQIKKLSNNVPKLVTELAQVLAKIPEQQKSIFDSLLKYSLILTDSQGALGEINRQAARSLVAQEGVSV